MIIIIVYFPYNNNNNVILCIRYVLMRVNNNRCITVGAAIRVMYLHVSIICYVGVTTTSVTTNCGDATGAAPARSSPASAVFT